MTKSVMINEYNLAYTEGQKPVYLQIYLVKNGALELGFSLSDSEEEALFMGALKGKVIYNTRVLDLFKKLKKNVKGEKKTD
jgi:hypothetical protein